MKRSTRYGTRGLSVLIAVFAVCVILGGCSRRDGLPVSSVVFRLPEKLYPAQYNEKRAEKIKKTSSYASLAYYISVKNDTIFISDTDPGGGSARSLNAAGGCFAGTPRGVTFLTSDGRSIPVTGESCAGLFTAPVGCIAVTDGGGSTHVYILEPTSGEQIINSRTVATVNGTPTAACAASDGGAVIIATGGDTPSLMRVGTDGKVTLITDSELYRKLDVMSVVEWQGRIFCSTKLGIYCFDPSSETELWYVLD